MDNYRAFLAIIISLAILVGYQYLFVGFNPQTAEKATPQQNVSENGEKAPVKVTPTASTAAPAQVAEVVEPAPKYDRKAEDIVVATGLYTAIFSEDGGVLKSFILKKYHETNKAGSPGMELVKTDASTGFPLDFSWGGVVKSRVLYESDSRNIQLSAEKDKAVLRMRARAGNGLTVERIYSFDNSTYLINLEITVANNSTGILQGTPQLHLVNKPFAGVESPAKRFLFSGPAAYVNGELEEVKAKEFKEGGKILQGVIDWAGYEGNYFLCGLLPVAGSGKSFAITGNEDLTRSHLDGELDTLQVGSENHYKYHIYFGPKKLDMLKSIGFNLDKSVNFGWFDLIAKPTLWLLNIFYGFCHNYGVAIIMVTVLFKGLFWPITQKGLKSMKNMQKLQPKMVKIKEKYKDDPTRMNQEVMGLYKTYKVNPLGGCLPMVLQIPVFFALYKVLLLSIELRHAPFMLWITDLSAPDRLWIGFAIPSLGGLPVLTLLMGASMFLQQKLSPTTADPTQAKIMMFLPLIFTFMFLNFASGLVLYWFVNNLLSILQQVLINRDRKKPQTA